MSTATFGQANHILTLVNQKEVSKEKLTALVESGLLADLLDADPANINRGAYRKLLGLTPAELTANINRGLSLREMVEAGHYDWVNDDITAERFPIKGSGSVETSFELVHFNRNIESDEAVKEMAKRGLRPADLAELLAFGAAFPEEQRKYPIVELGSVARIGGSRYVACLYRDDSRRSLSLLRWGGSWDADYRFLAVRN
jgi:hypothetical protein